MEPFVIRIEGPIGADPWSLEDGMTGQTVRGWLAGREDEDVTVWINSPGGDVIEGSAIYTALREHRGHVTVKVDGIAASAASIIAMGGDELLMSPSSYLMIHRASTMAWGNAGEMEQAKEQLEAVDAGLIDVYQKKTGLSRPRIQEMLDNETFLNASAAVRLGFADGMLYGEAPETPAEEQKLAARSRPVMWAALGKPPAWCGELLRPKAQPENRQPEAGTEPEEEPAPAPSEPEAEPGEDPVMQARQELMGHIEKALKG